ncbi:MAG: hypothetical protein HXX16_10430 [Bacteroidales bacterium]|nr:hypothetical protein [Bacteroidales bacterium]
MANINLKRNFIIGDEWLYYKIYSGPKSTDYILTSILLPLINKLLNEKTIDKWFFIRYNDPDLHLRIRLHVQDIQRLIIVISNFNKEVSPLVDKRIISKIQVDTYKREIERYGEKTMEDSENLFYLDSNCIIKFLDLLDGEEVEEYRWLFGLHSIDCLLNDFGYNLKDKKELLNTLQTSYANEFNLNTSLKYQLDTKYRMYREKIIFFLSSSINNEPELSPIIELIRKRSSASTEVVKSIKTKLIQEEINSIIFSYIHMNLNRLFRTKHREHELAIYYLLYKHH